MTMPIQFGQRPSVREGIRLASKLMKESGGTKMITPLSGLRLTVAALFF